MFLFPQLLCWGSVDVPALLAELTHAWEASHIMRLIWVSLKTMLATETSARQAAAAWDNAALRIKNAEDRAALMEGVALERISRAKAENAAALASTREDAEGFVRKITLLEDELTSER
jgi:hypothetical protein